MLARVFIIIYNNNWDQSSHKKWGLLRSFLYIYMQSESVIQTKRLLFILPWRDCSFSKCYNFIRSCLLFFYLHNTKWLKLDPYFRFLFYPFSSVIYLSIKIIISNSFIINKEYQHFRRERWVRCDRAEPVPVRL